MTPTLTVIPDVAAAACNLPGARYIPACIVGDAAGAVAGAAANAIEFGTDPLGYIAQKLQFAAAGLAKEVLGGLQDITHPDLSMAWFRNAYSVSFGIAIFVMVILLAIQLVQLAQRQVSGDEVVSTLSFYVPAFLFGTLLGPGVGSMLVALSGALSEQLVLWGITSNAQMTTQNLIRAIAAGDQVGTAFGAVTSILLYACLIVSLLLTFLVLLVIVVTLYLTGVLVPLSLVWLTSPTQRRRGMTLIKVWLGLNFSHVLIFFLLGTAFQMVNGLTITLQGAGLQGIANLLLAAIALFMATLSPFGLLKFGNAVMPSNGPESGGRIPAPSLPAGGERLLQGIAQDSATAQTSRSNSSPAETAPSSGSGAGSQGSAPGGPGAGTSLTDRVKSRASESSVSGIEAGGFNPAGSGGAESTDASSGGGGGLSTATAAPKLVPVGASGGAGGAGAAAEAATAAEATGAVASATGVGALAGVPIMAAGFVLGAASQGVGQVTKMADAAVDLTQDQMRHGEDDGQGELRPRRDNRRD